MVPIHVYIHVPTIGEFRPIVSELMGTVAGCGLYDAADSITAVITGEPSRPFPAWQRVEWATVPCDPHTAYEFPTLSAVHNRALTDPEAVYLYLHAKGSSKPERRNREPHPTDTWRRYMSYVVLEHWRRCVALLDRFDTVGTEIRLPPRHVPRHYAGNFWWATGQHVSSLSTPRPVLTWGNVRYSAETWVLSSPTENARHYSAFDLDSLNVVQLAKRPLLEGLYRGVEWNH